MILAYSERSKTCPINASFERSKKEAMVDRSFCEINSSSTLQFKEHSFDLEIKKHYLSNKLKDRLGNIKNPFFYGGILGIVTFGLYFFIWYRHAIAECALHLDHPIAYLKAKSWWKAALPFYHCIMAYKLANMILEMEVQNQYQKTSPVLAFFLSSFPPLCIIYLQSSLNTHWKIHGSFAKEQCLLEKIRLK